MYRFIILLVMISITGIAQEVTFQDVETKTYELFEKENWYELAKYGKELAPQKIDYYYFNVRMGIAHFNLGAYYKATCYFNHALKNNTTDFAKSYIYWCYVNLGQTDRAKEIYAQLTEETQATIVNDNKYLTSVYTEAGLKNSNNTLQDNLTYYSLSGSHRFTDKISATTSVGFISQNSGWESNSQYQLGAFPSYYLSKGQSISAGYVFANNINKQTGNSTFIGAWNATTSITNNVLTLNYSKQFHRARAEGFIQYISQNKVITGSAGVTSSNTVISNTILGANFSYTLPVNKDGLTLGATIVSAFGNSSAILFSPFITAKITPKLFLKTTYYSVNNFLYLDAASNILFTNTATKTERIAAVLTYAINPTWQVIGTYSNETITNTNTTLNHKLNSFFLGLNYNF